MTVDIIFPACALAFKVMWDRHCDVKLGGNPTYWTGHHWVKIRSCYLIAQTGLLCTIERMLSFLFCVLLL